MKCIEKDSGLPACCTADCHVLGVGLPSASLIDANDWSKGLVLNFQGQERCPVLYCCDLSCRFLPPGFLGVFVFSVPSSARGVLCMLLQEHRLMRTIRSCVRGTRRPVLRTIAR